ncbi:MAG: acyltransferase family protein [Alphaproteobacteria bacterium]|nr:acyltransferase family protein [Alphaproteobacteria bacterium]
MLRLFLASAVMVEHVPVVINGLGSPLIAANGWSIGYAAVNGFFILSGFLIADSLERRRDLATYAASRILRIMPALVVLALLAVLVIGPLFTTVEPQAYWRSLATWGYVPNVVFFLDTSGAPEGLFATNPAPGEFSATLWTLRYEVIAYIGAAVLFFTGFAWRRTVLTALFIVMAFAHAGIMMAWPDGPALLVNLFRLGAAFLVGMSVYAWRDRLPLLPVAALVAGPVWFLSGDHPAAEILLNIALASGLFWLAFSKRLGPTFSRMPDWSYGIYIWHYPLFQILWFTGVARGETLLVAVGIPATLLVSALSWHLIERPSLARKADFGRWLSGRPRTGADEGRT